MTTDPANSPPYSCSSLTFQSGHEHCHAWLYQPKHSAGEKTPAIILAHGLGGVKRLCLAAFAERFAAAGYACLVFDYRYFGDSTGEPRELLNIQSQLADWRAAVKFARSIDSIDADRIIVWGTSFGGGHAIVTAADDPRIAAAIAQCPFTDGPASVLAIHPWTNLKLATMGVIDLLAKVIGAKPVRVPLAADPGETALMTAADALPGANALLVHANMEDLPDLVPARIALYILFHRPGRRIQNLRNPLLLCVCANDSVAPADATLKYAAKSANTTVKLYQANHFDIYWGEPFEQVINDQIEFLKRHVPITKPVD